MRGNLGRAPPELTFFDMRAVVLMSSVFDLVRYSEFPDAHGPQALPLPLGMGVFKNAGLAGQLDTVVTGGSS